jgi:hypothetical protein
MKNKLSVDGKDEGSEPVTKCNRLKMMAEFPVLNRENIGWIFWKLKSSPNFIKRVLNIF